MYVQVELGVIIGREASRIKRQAALDYVGGYCIALDMTDRGMQDKLKAAGHPWFLAKSFDAACPVGEFIDKMTIEDPHNVEIYTKGQLAYVSFCCLCSYRHIPNHSTIHFVDLNTKTTFISHTLISNIFELNYPHYIQ